MARTIIKRAETFRRNLRFTHRTTGANIDLSGCTARCQMRDEPGGTLLADAQCTVEGVTGKVIVVFDKNVTAGLPLGEAGYDVWLVADGEQRPIFTEKVTIVDPYTDMTEVESGS